MKTLKTTTFALLASVMLFSSCATVFGGKVTQAQKRTPMPGEPQRAIRPVALIADILLFWPGLIVDFATGAIYKPQGNGMKTPEKKTDVVKAEITVD